MPSPSPSLTLLAILLSFFIHLVQSLTSSCPPFSSKPLFPFSSLPGHGHPSFHLRCSSPHSLLSINGLSFSLLSFNATSSTLLLSPLPLTLNESTHTCFSPRFSFIPTRSINFSASPFRISDGYCSRLSVLRPCSPPRLPNCSHCPWDCNLIKRPLHLLHGCGVERRSVSKQGCQGEVLEYLDRILRLGIEVEWDTDQDPYFVKCKDCEARNGDCGFNSSDPDRHFICYHTQTRYSFPNRIAILFSVFALICLFLVIAVTTVFLRSRWLRSLASEVDPTAQFLSRHRSPNLLPPVFPYEELESSTNRFDPKRKLGDGGFGSVYLGQLNDGRLVAVKYLHKHHGASRERREMALADLVVSKIQMGQLHQVVDSVLGIDGEVIDGVEAVAELAFRCVAADKDDRPDAKEIVEELRRIRNRTRGGDRSSISNVGDDVDIR
ncbi:LEAF RUST 10 DISEASE-RESISTANCE LOCUS RECEPTOR-LIKE PROTEIN KINASE-like 1.5, partial [Cucurbita argyrosperma subsp. sororia]